MNTNKIDELCVKTIRMLSVDEVERAKSGHPGMPLGAAPMAYVLWDRFLKHNPVNPAWFNRDRFILSAGHGSALLYALLNLSGYDMPLSELERFRQLGSATPGHPERDPARGVEATTGPLGQGFAMGVGMALAEKLIAAKVNRPGFDVVDHFTYAIVSDGDLMEGVASEAASLAGHLKLGKLVYLYDDNRISIEGRTSITFTEDVLARFSAYGWHTLQVDDGEDLEAISKAIEEARSEKERPSLIAVRTHIGFGSPKADSASAHGEPLGPEARAKTRDFFGWPKEGDFFIPEEASSHMRLAIERGREGEAASRALWERYRAAFPLEAARFEKERGAKPPPAWDERIPTFGPSDAMATREASGKAMNAFSLAVENFVGGSADLGPSTKTLLAGFGDAGTESDAPRNIRYGVREFAMAAITNGMAIHGGIIPYASTFLVFSDYMRPAIRLAALMKSRSIFVFTHDSIGLGEDGPTHQPVEQLMSLRLIPGLTVIRPADPNETAFAWRVAMERGGPVALVLSRQKVPVLSRHEYPVEGGVKRGGYVLAGDGEDPDCIIIATGAEVHTALSARELLAAKGKRARVVSMPSWELFAEQPREYRDEVLPPPVRRRISVEAGRTSGWERWVGEGGIAVGVDSFGASAPASVLFEKFGLTANAVAEKALSLCSG